MSTKIVSSSLRVWWIPQVTGEPFHRNVTSVAEGKRLLETLAEYDRFQFENNIKPDYCNAGGLEMMEDGEWSDWADENGNSIDDVELADLE